MKKWTISGIVAVFAVTTLAASASAQYVKLASLAEVGGGAGNTFLAGFAIDGTAGTFLLSTGVNARITQLADLGGANTFSTLVSPTAYTAASGRTTIAAAYAGISGTTLVFGETGGDQLYNASTVVADTISVTGTNASLDAFAGSATSNIAFGTVSPSSGAPYFYESFSDDIITNTGTNTYATAVDMAVLTSISGGSVINGLAIQGNTLYFGNNAFDGLYSYNLTTNSGGTVLSAAAINAALGIGTGATVNNTGMFGAPNGLVYYFDTALDSIISFDPADAANTIDVVLSNADLIAGPGGGAGITQLGWFNGRLAFILGTTAGGQAPGVYAIPEPSSLALLGLCGLTLLGRRRS
ncbi:MAG: PEP-CTERM sorting domain-containing protein [Bythopirellula sp.]|nr:PEP-CTERM sorting domain-containing protein [Bythopirellula sp.]